MRIRMLTSQNRGNGNLFIWHVTCNIKMKQAEKTNCRCHAIVCTQSAISAHHITFWWPNNEKTFSSYRRWTKIIYLIESMWWTEIHSILLFDYLVGRSKLQRNITCLFVYFAIYTFYICMHIYFMRSPVGSFSLITYMAQQQKKINILIWIGAWCLFVFLYDQLHSYTHHLSTFLASIFFGLSNIKRFIFKSVQIFKI